MSLMRTGRHICAVLSLAAAACGVEQGDSVPEVEQGDTLGASEAALTSGPATGKYYSVRHDLRRCASPLCGGFFVSEVNQLQSLCADGRLATECYVTDLELQTLGLSPSEQETVRGGAQDFLVRGNLTLVDTVFGPLGSLRVTEAWQGHPGVTPSGTFFRVGSLGIECVTSPCATLEAQRLNLSTAREFLAQLDLQGIAPDVSDGQARLADPEGLLVAARRLSVTGPAGSMGALDASEYYVPFPPPPRACGSRGLQSCAPDEFCDFPDTADCGRADRPGTCQPRPQFCIQLFDPVCGCDGQTYSNACVAAAAGVSVDSDGPCAPPLPRACGSRGLAACEAGEFCSFEPAAECGRTDRPGTCQPRPEVCTKEFAPVCGCDGQTYGNACAAAVQGVSVDFTGACPPKKVACGGFLGNTCGAGEFCDIPVENQCGIADGGGFCEPRPSLCTLEFRPVCGCDGRSYSNACAAHSAGVSVAKNAACYP